MAVRSPGFGRPRNDHRERARELLLDTALHLFAEKGYVGVRVEDIAKAAGISRATFYTHFSEREEILAELFARLVGRDAFTVPPDPTADPPSQVRALLTAVATRMLDNEQLARFVYTLPIRHASLTGEGFRPALLDTVQRLVADGASRGDVRGDVSPATLTAHIARAFEAAMRDWAEGRVDDAVPHLATLLDLAFHGAAAQPHAAPRASARPCPPTAVPPSGRS